MIQIKPLSDLIKWVDFRNKGIISENLLGINIDKCFMPSVANIIGTDLSNYKLISKHQFACNPMHVGRDEKMPIALYCEDQPSIVSPAYFVFEVKDSGLINPDYLMLWFRRAEFDRECWFHTDGSVRGGITWEEIIEMAVPVPPINEQNAIVEQYRDIERRIELKQQINDNLESQALALFNDRFGNAYIKNKLPNGWKQIELGNVCSIKGGKRLPADCELTDIPTRHPYIRVRDVGLNRYICLTDRFQYIDDNTYNKLSRYIVNTNDIVISIVGTIGLIGKIHTSLDGANLTENCIRLTGSHIVTPDYLYYTLIHKKHTKEIDLLTVGAVQAKLPIYNIQSMKIILPPYNELIAFQTAVDIINKQTESNTLEIERLETLKRTILTSLSR